MEHTPSPFLCLWLPATGPGTAASPMGRAGQSPYLTEKLVDALTVCALLVVDARNW